MKFYDRTGNVSFFFWCGVLREVCENRFLITILCNFQKNVMYNPTSNPTPLADLRNIAFLTNTNMSYNFQITSRTNFFNDYTLTLGEGVYESRFPSKSG